MASPLTRIGATLITGAGSGIGRATALLFASRGCKELTIADINNDPLKETREMIRKAAPETDVLSVELDVRKEESVNNMVTEHVKKFGRLDHACNVAGLLRPGMTTDTSVPEWDLMFEVNTRGMWLCHKAEIKQMLTQEPKSYYNGAVQERGAIVNVASMAGLLGYEGLPAYAASKHAAVAFTKSDGFAYGRSLIRINAVCPGVIATPMLGVVPEMNTPEAQNMTATTSLGRMGLPEEIAESLIWLTSPQASFVNASAIMVNGGMLN